MCEVKRGELYIPNTGSRDLIVIEEGGHILVEVSSLFSGDFYMMETQTLKTYWEQVGTVSKS